MTKVLPINKAQKRSFVSPSVNKTHTIHEMSDVYSIEKSLRIHSETSDLENPYGCQATVVFPALLLFLFICPQIDCLKMRTAEALSAEYLEIDRAN